MDAWSLMWSVKKTRRSLPWRAINRWPAWSCRQGRDPAIVSFFFFYKWSPTLKKRKEWAIVKEKRNETSLDQRKRDHIVGALISWGWWPTIHVFFRHNPEHFDFNPKIIPAFKRRKRNNYAGNLGDEIIRLWIVSQHWRLDSWKDECYPDQAFIV